MARTMFAVGVPAETGRAVWVGHQFWSRDYAARRAARRLAVRGHARHWTLAAGGPAQPACAC